MQLKGNILVVESDDLILGLLERWLGEGGYHVIVRTSGMPGKPIDERLPQLIILDIPDPRAGVALLQSLRAAYPSPILVISARFRRGLGDSAEVARQLGAHKILPKPFTRKELLTAVRESLAKH